MQQPMRPPIPPAHGCPTGLMGPPGRPPIEDPSPLGGRRQRPLWCPNSLIPPPSASRHRPDGNELRLSGREAQGVHVRVGQIAGRAVFVVPKLPTRPWLRALVALRTPKGRLRRPDLSVGMWSRSQLCQSRPSTAFDEAGGECARAILIGATTLWTGKTRTAAVASCPSTVKQ